MQLIEEEGVQDALVTPSGLREISTYADGIAPHKGRILLHGADGTLVGVSDLITQAHRAGLTVEPWTLRPENLFLPSHLRRGSDPSGVGDAQTESRLLLRPRRRRRHHRRPGDRPPRPRRAHRRGDGPHPAEMTAILRTAPRPGAVPAQLSRFVRCGRSLGPAPASHSRPPGRPWSPSHVTGAGDGWVT